MIKVTSYSISSGKKHEESPQLLHPYGALRRLAVFELGYGGRITRVHTRDDQTIITITTNFANCVETNIFSGSQHEMSMLVEFLGCYMVVAKARKMEVMSKSVLDALSGSDALIPENIGPMLIGTSEVFSALVIWAGLETEEQVDLAKSIVSCIIPPDAQTGRSGLSGLIEVIEFVRELDISFEESCQQVGGVGPESSAVV